MASSIKYQFGHSFKELFVRKNRLTQILIFIAIFISSLTSFAQVSRVDTLIIPRTEASANIGMDQLMFPVIRTTNKDIENAINTDLKKRFTNNEFPEVPADSSLIKWSDGISYLNFRVTYLEQGIISLHINAEGCGAYCTGWTDYFTYNYETGEYLTIDKVIDTTGKFRRKVIADKNQQYRQQVTDLKRRLKETEDGFDRYTYETVLEHYRECSRSFSFKSFALHNDHLEIIEECYLPNVIKSMSPEIDLSYRYENILKYLKLKLRN